MNLLRSGAARRRDSYQRQAEGRARPSPCSGLRSPVDAHFAASVRREAHGGPTGLPRRRRRQTETNCPKQTRPGGSRTANEGDQTAPRRGGWERNGSSQPGLPGKSEDRLGGSDPGEEGQGPVSMETGEGAGYPSPWKQRRGGVSMVTGLGSLLGNASGGSLSPAPPGKSPAQAASSSAFYLRGSRQRRQRQLLLSPAAP